MPALAPRRSCPARASPSRLPQADAWFDSRHVPHDVRWDLPLPSWEAVHDYLARTLEDTLAGLGALDDERLDHAAMALAHEDMHGEAMLMTLQTLGLPAPPGIGLRAAGPRPSRTTTATCRSPAGPFTIGTPDGRARALRVGQREGGARRCASRPSPSRAGR